MTDFLTGSGRLSEKSREEHLRVTRFFNAENGRLQAINQRFRFFSQP